jgi:hypothetical protein
VHERRSDPVGVAALIEHKRAPMNGGLVPAEIIHNARREQTWRVLEVLGHWEHPDGIRAKGPVVSESWRLLVRGPLPWRPSVRGEFVMRVRGYADLPSWWIEPEAE